MTRTGEGLQPVFFDSRPLAFIRAQIEMAARDLEGPLAKRLLHVPLKDALSFLAPAVAERAASNWEHGGIGAGGSDLRLASALSRWLPHAESGRERVVVLEEPLGRRRDPASSSLDVHYEDRVYFAAVGGRDANTLRELLGSVSGYPGIGVVADTVRGVVRGEMLDEDLDALVSGAVAVLVRAWDDEAFLIARPATETARRHAPRWE